MTHSGMLELLLRQARVADEAAQRPWPLPEEPWAQAQTRRDVLLAHWPVELDRLARLLPPELPVDTFDGAAWLGIAAYRVEALRVRGLPPLPGLSSFPQLEVVSYVAPEGRPGTWLFSLDVAKGLLAEAAKRTHRLPAYRARITTADGPEGIRFEVDREGLVFRASYRGTGAASPAEPGTLEHFLTERYALYTADGGRLYRAELHHPPWLLRAAEARVEVATLAPVLLEGEPLALFAESQDLLVWPLEEL